MSLVVPPGFGLASIILGGPTGTAPYVTTLGVATSTASGDFVGIANRVLEAYKEAFGTLTSDELSIDRVSLLVGSDGGNGSVDSTNGPRTGSREVEMAPTAMSLIARKSTNLLGRNGRGRMFIPGILADGDVNASGRIEENSEPGFQMALNDFGFNLVRDDEEWSQYPIAPPFLLHSDAPGAPSPTLIAGLTVGPLVGWIRGRIR